MFQDEAGVTLSTTCRENPELRFLHSDSVNDVAEDPALSKMRQEVCS